VVLRTLLISKRRKKGDEEKNSSLTQAGGRREKELTAIQYNSLVYGMHYVSSPFIEKFHN
jgi:hypothetical protein